MIPASTDATFRFGDIQVDAAAHRVARSGVEVELEPKAFQVLLFLLQNPNRLVTKEELIANVWSGAFVTDNALTRVIAQLRKALGDDAKHARYIETVPTQGYRFVALVNVAEPLAPPAPISRWLRMAANPGPAVWIAFTLLLIAAGLLLNRKDAAPPSPGSIRGYQFTSSTGLELWASFSPDGNLLAYASDRTGRFEIHVKPLAPGGREIALTSDGQQNVMPAWSPDGKWIAYHAAATGAIRVIPAQGGVPRTIADSGVEAAWSPDSRRIVFRTGPYLSPIIADTVPPVATVVQTVDLEGGAPKNLTEPLQPAGAHSSPCWHPSDGYIYFNGIVWKKGSGVWRVRADQDTPAAPEQVSSFHLFGSVTCTPDGKHLYLTGFDGNQFGIARLDLSRPSSPPEFVLRTGMALARAVSVSRDGKMAYTHTAMTSNLQTLPIDPRAARPRGQPVPLTNESAYRVTLPAFSPDGSRVAYNVRRYGQESDIYVIPAEGGEPQQLTTHPAAEIMATWLPDGKTVAYSSQATDAGAALFKIGLDDARPVEMLKLKPGVGMVRLSPNGRELLYHGLGTAMTIRRATVPDQTERIFNPETPGVGFPIWSRDGSQIVAERFDGNNTHLVVAPSAGGPWKQLTHQPGQAWPYGTSPDGRRISFAALRKGLWSLRWIDRETAREEILYAPEFARGFLRYPEWSPRGDRIVFEKVETKGNIYIVDLP